MELFVRAAYDSRVFPYLLLSRWENIKLAKMGFIGPDIVRKQHNMIIWLPEGCCESGCPLLFVVNAINKD